MFGNDDCPVCFGILEEIGIWGLDAEDKTYGCRQCNATYHYKRPTGCFGEAGFIKQEETLTEYEAKIADRPQVEIRRRKKILDEEVETARVNMETSRRTFEIVQSSYNSKLAEIQKDCEHPNADRTAITKTCKDCGVFGVTGV